MVGLVRFQNVDGEVQELLFVVRVYFYSSVYPLGPFGLHTHTDPRALHWG